MKALISFFLAILATGQPVRAQEHTDASVAGRQAFLVVWTIDYGYALYKQNDQITPITPEFANSTARQAFDAFFGQDNLQRVAGKRIFCDCLGQESVRDGARVFRISSARVYAAR